MLSQRVIQCNLKHFHFASRSRDKQANIQREKRIRSYKPVTFFAFFPFNSLVHFFIFPSLSVCFSMFSYFYFYLISCLSRFLNFPFFRICTFSFISLFFPFFRLPFFLSICLYILLKSHVRGQLCIPCIIWTKYIK
jgi:hypothetical protein